MPWWARLLIHYGAPLVAEAVGALLRSIAATGAKADPTMQIAIDIVAGLEQSDVPSAERRERAVEAVRLYLVHATGQEPAASLCGALVEVALQRVRNAPAR